MCIMHVDNFDTVVLEVYAGVKLCVWGHFKAPKALYAIIVQASNKRQSIQNNQYGIIIMHKFVALRYVIIR